AHADIYCRALRAGFSLAEARQTVVVLSDARKDAGASPATLELHFGVPGQAAARAADVRVRRPAPDHRAEARSERPAVDEIRVNDEQRSFLGKIGVLGREVNTRRAAASEQLHAGENARIVNGALVGL